MKYLVSSEANADIMNKTDPQRRKATRLENKLLGHGHFSRRDNPLYFDEFLQLNNYSSIWIHVSYNIYFTIFLMLACTSMRPLTSETFFLSKPRTDFSLFAGTIYRSCHGFYQSL